jgi:hypothetical protein
MKSGKRHQLSLLSIMDFFLIVRCISMLSLYASFYKIWFSHSSICLFFLIFLIFKFALQWWIKMKKKKYHTVWTILKSNIKIVERGKVDTLTHTHTRPLTFSLGAGTSIKSGGVKLVLWVQFLIVYFLLRSNKNVDTESVNFQKHLKLDFWLFKKNIHIHTEVYLKIVS